MIQGDNMSRFTRFQKIVLVCIAISICLGFMTKGKSSIITSLVYDPFTMLKYSVIDYPIETAKNWVNDFNRLWLVKEENDQLRYELSQQEQYAATLQEQERHILELEELIAMSDSTNFDKIYAKIVNRNPETWNNIITLNRGKSNGVKENMAVISNKGLIGKVIEVSEMTCKVRLLTSQDQLSKVTVKIAVDKEKSVDAFLQEYSLEKNSYIVRLYGGSEEIKVGMKVITSGSGGVFPNGLLVGEVNEVVELKNEIGKLVYVTPAVDFDSFEYVAIINASSYWETLALVNVSATQSVQAYLYDYDEKNNQYLMRLASDANLIAVGMSVRSSPNEVYPNGTLIGTISEIKEVNNQLIATIDSAVSPLVGGE